MAGGVYVCVVGGRGLVGAASGAGDAARAAAAPAINPSTISSKTTRASPSGRADAVPLAASCRAAVCGQARTCFFVGSVLGTESPPGTSHYEIKRERSHSLKGV